MKRFFKTFMCCGSTNHINTSAISAPGNLSIVPNPDRQHQVIELEILEKKEPSEKRIARVDSQYNPGTLQCSNFRPTGGEELRYNCPICFRFFDKILETSCCANYICHFCIEDLNMTITKADKVHKTRCPFCNDEEFTLKDVDPQAKLKRYTDSPCISIKSRKMRTSSQLSLSLSGQLTGKPRHKTIGRTELSRVEDVATTGFDVNRKDVSRIESEGVIGPEEVDLRMSADKRCATEPAPVVRTLIMSEDVDEDLRKARNFSVHDYPLLKSLRLPETKRPVWNDYFVIPEVPIGSEATPYLPNSEVYKKSYESESNC